MTYYIKIFGVAGSGKTTYCMNILLYLIDNHNLVGDNIEEVLKNINYLPNTYTLYDITFAIHYLSDALTELGYEFDGFADTDNTILNRIDNLFMSGDIKEFGRDYMAASAYIRDKIPSTFPAPRLQEQKPVLMKVKLIPVETPPEDVNSSYKTETATSLMWNEPPNLRQAPLEVIPLRELVLVISFNNCTVNEMERMEKAFRKTPPVYDLRREFMKEVALQAQARGLTIAEYCHKNKHDYNIAINTLNTVIKGARKLEL